VTKEEGKGKREKGRKNEQRAMNKILDFIRKIIYI